MYAEGKLVQRLPEEGDRISKMCLVVVEKPSQLWAQSPLPCQPRCLIVLCSLSPSSLEEPRSHSTDLPQFLPLQITCRSSSWARNWCRSAVRRPVLSESHGSLYEVHLWIQLKPDPAQTSTLAGSTSHFLVANLKGNWLDCLGLMTFHFYPF